MDLLSSLKYLQLWVSLHHLQDDVAADGVTNQQQKCLLRYMLPKEGQLVFNLSIEAENILLLRNRCIFKKEQISNITRRPR